MNRLRTLLLVLACAATARAAETQLLTHSESLDSLVGVVLRDNAQLRAMRARAEAMRERPAQVGALPNPMFRYGGMDMIERGNWPNTGEKRFMLEQEFPAPGKLGLKARIAGQEAEAMQRDFEAMQREIVMMLKETYFDLFGVQRARAITSTEQEVLKRLVQSAESMYATGERSQQDVLKAQAETTMLQQKLLELEQQENMLKAKLNLLLNRPSDSPLGVTVTTPESVLPAGAARPEIRKAEADLRRSELERALMGKEFWPDYRLGLEYRSFRAEEDMLMFTVGFDLPIWRGKYRAGVREADKMIEAGKANLEAVQRQASFEVQDATFKLQSARRTLELYQKKLIPQAQARFEASEVAYRTGKADFMDLLESQRFLLNARLMAAMAEGNVGMQAARLERAVGTEPKETR